MGLARSITILKVSISSTAFALVDTESVKNIVKSSVSFLRFWDIWVQKLLLERWWNCTKVCFKYVKKESASSSVNARALSTSVFQPVTHGQLSMDLQSSHFAKFHYKTGSFYYYTVFGLIKFVDYLWRGKVDDLCRWLTYGVCLPEGRKAWRLHARFHLFNLPLSSYWSKKVPLFIIILKKLSQVLRAKDSWIH